MKRCLRAAHAAGEFVEVAVFIGVQPRHGDRGGGDAGDEERGESGAHEAAVHLQARDRPAGCDAAEHGERRHHEDEMADAVVERRMRDRWRGRRAGRPRRPASAGWRALPAAWRERAAAIKAPTTPASPSASSSSGSLSSKQMRQILTPAFRVTGSARARRTVRATAFRTEERVEIFGGADRIERRDDRPWPQQGHDQIAEHEARQHFEQNWPSRWRPAPGLARGSSTRRSAAGRMPISGAAKPASTRDPNAGAEADRRTARRVRQRRPRIFFERAHRAEQQHRSWRPRRARPSRS